MSFNIFDRLAKDLQDYNYSHVMLAQTSQSGYTHGYRHSQKDVLNVIELYHASQFESGRIDSEGQRKYFLNIVRFRQEVAEKQTDIDVKDFTFVPEDGTPDIAATIMAKDFRRYSKKKKFGKVLNQLNRDYSKYGTCVAKLVGDEICRVNLLKLRCQQDAESLECSSYVIIEHTAMTKQKMADYPDWDISGIKLEDGDSTDVYEWYGWVPVDWYNAQTGSSMADTPSGMVYIEAVLAPKIDPNKKGGRQEGGTILFIEKTDCLFREAHYSRIDGRWLGVGEVEKNIENQIFRNTVANFRRKGLAWASKKIFQSTDTDIAQNLVRDVQDGEVLKIAPNGELKQVNLNTQSLGEFDDAAKEIEQNADQTSFTFEVATGEGMPSGTPFRLGVILSKAVDSYYSLKRENLGLFLEELFYELMLPAFRKESRKDHALYFTNDDASLQAIRKKVIDYHVYKNAMDEMLKGNIIDLNRIRSAVEAKINARPGELVTLDANYYDLAVKTVTLVITGENINIEKRIESLTNLFTALKQSGDPRADLVLEKVMTLTGEDMTQFSAPKQASAISGPNAATPGAVPSAAAALMSNMAGA